MRPRRRPAAEDHLPVVLSRPSCTSAGGRGVLRRCCGQVHVPGPSMGRDTVRDSQHHHPPNTVLRPLTRAASEFNLSRTVDCVACRLNGIRRERGGDKRGLLPPVACLDPHLQRLRLRRRPGGGAAARQEGVEECTLIAGTCYYVMTIVNESVMDSGRMTRYGLPLWEKPGRRRIRCWAQRQLSRLSQRPQRGLGRIAVGVARSDPSHR